MTDKTERMITNLEAYRERKNELAQKFNVVDLPGSPMALAPLHAIGWEIIAVRIGKDDGDFYPQSGKLAPTKRLLNRIGMVAGVRWQRIQRVDDHRRPHARRFEVEGVVLFTDGTLFPLYDDKEIDLSGIKGQPDTWSARVSQIVAQAERASAKDVEYAKKDGRPTPPPRDPWIQILQERSTIDERATTGAKNRAIRNGLGINDTYTVEDAKRGFAVFRTYITGDDEDPYIRREFKRAIIAARFGATASLYGRTEREDRAELPPGIEVRPALPAKCEDETPHDPQTGEIIDVDIADPPQISEPPADAQVLGDRGANGRWTTVAASDLSLDAIIEKIERTERALAAGKVQKPDEANAQLAILRAWQQYRERVIPSGDADTPF